jgi:hypothetical protein
MTEYLSSKNIQRPKHEAYAKVLGLKGLRVRPSLFLRNVGYLWSHQPGRKTSLPDKCAERCA